MSRFGDWPGEMSREELRVFLDSWFCGCGMPEEATAALVRLLTMMNPGYEHHAERTQWVGDDGLEHLLLYALDHFELIEHGGSVGGSWLTPKGLAVLTALKREEEDGFVVLLDGEDGTGYCAHGFDSGSDHSCFEHQETARAYP